MKLREQMFELVAAYEQSGKSQKEYCQTAGIGLAKLNYWIKKYRMQQPLAGFIKVDPFVGESQQLEILYPNGVGLKAAGTDLSLISQLIRLY